MKSKVIEKPEWEIIRRGWDPSCNKVNESIFSLGNEYMGLRGFFEEKYSGDSLKGTYTAGIYYPDKTRVGWWKNGYPEFFAKILNNTNWVGIDIVLNGKELDLHSSEYKVENFVRRLNMETAEYTRTFDVCDKEGKKTSFKFSRFVSMDDKNAAHVSVKVTPENYSGDIVLKPYLDGNVRNEDSNYDEVFWDRGVETVRPWPSVTMETKKTLFRQTCAMACICRNNGKKLAANTSRMREKYVEQEFCASLSQGEPVELNKVVCLYTSRDIRKDKLEKTCLSKLTELVQVGDIELYKSHCEAIKKMWDQYDVIIEGDPKAQQGIRFSILGLIQTYSGVDSRLNIGPKGFTGEKYGGTTYWDTEAFCFSFYLYSDSAIARQLLLYRYEHLGRAKENARKLGLDGALYPMVTIDGQECHNEWEITFEEIHRNGVIAYAIYNYTNFTDDKAYLKNYGMEVLVELCRFWASRVTYNKNKDCYMLLGVTGPNEYENNVNNNYYTNTMAAWTLEYTLKLLKEFSPKNMPDISETDKWKSIVSKMYYPYVDDLEIFEQNDTFMDKELLPADDIPKKERPIYQNWSWDKVLRSCYIKQADVLQAMYLFPRKYSLEQQRRNFDFYEPMTVHESSLSPSVYSVVASRVGYRKKAYELYLRTSRLDLENVNNDTNEGLHITSMGATWAAVVNGFAGIEVVGAKLSINPRLPKEWKSLCFKMNFRESQISIKISEKQVELRVKGNYLNINIEGHEYGISPGDCRIIDIKQID